MRDVEVPVSGQVQGRNGTFEIKALVAVSWGTKDDDDVNIWGIGRNTDTAINGGFCINISDLDHFAIKWLESRGYPIELMTEPIEEATNG